MKIALPEAGAGSMAARLVEKTHLTADIVRIRLRTDQSFDFRPGQFINLSRADGLTRSYSIASLPMDGVIEIHVRKVPQGQMSRWLYEDARIGEQLGVRGPNGDCFYVPGRPDRLIVLIGTGTGLAPLLGIAFDALLSGHVGRIALFHGGRRPADLYMHADLITLSNARANFSYFPSALDHEGDPSVHKGRIDDYVESTFPDLTGAQVFLCGDPKIVQKLKELTYRLGAEADDIYADLFVSAPPPKANRSDKPSPIKAKFMDLVADRQWVQKLRYGVQAATLSGFILQGVLYYEANFRPLGGLLPFMAYESLGHRVVSSALLAWGILFFLVIIFGRFVCGWLCPFGFFQDTGEKILRFFKVPLPKPVRQPRAARYILALLVLSHFVFMPLLANPIRMWQVDLHFKEPWTLGFPFNLSLFLLDLVLIFLVIGIILPVIFGPRPYCKLVCETGLMLDNLSKMSLGRIRRNDGFDRDTCLSCQKCTNICPQGVNVYEEVHLFDRVVNSNCISCFQCVGLCPNNTIVYSLRAKMRDTGRIAGYLAALDLQAQDMPRYFSTTLGVVAGGYLGLIFMPPSYIHTYLLFAALGGLTGWLAWRLAVEVSPIQWKRWLKGEVPPSQVELQSQKRLLPLTPAEKLKLKGSSFQISKRVILATAAALSILIGGAVAVVQRVPPAILPIEKVSAERRDPAYRDRFGLVQLGIPEDNIDREVQEAYSALARYLSHDLGKRVIVVSTDRKEIEAGLESGLVDLAILSPKKFVNFRRRAPGVIEPVAGVQAKDQLAHEVIVEEYGPGNLQRLPTDVLVARKGCPLFSWKYCSRRSLSCAYQK